jgi:hypothetical protein
MLWVHTTKELEMLVLVWIAFIALLLVGGPWLWIKITDRF